MNASETCIAGIKECEGFRADAYQDVVGVWTVGYGYTAGVRPGDRVSEAVAEAQLRAVVARIAASLSLQIRAQIPSERTVAQGQFDALVSFAYNLGVSTLLHSTLWKLFVAGEPAAAADEFPRWCHAGDEVLSGLVKRREMERSWFFGADVGTVAA